MFTLPEWLRYREVLGPLVEQVVAPLKTPFGVITRLALVRLNPGGHILPHTDGHAMALKAHRIHVPLTSSPAVEYKIGGRKLAMRAGHAYDFNNRVRHSVRNKGKRPRVNLFVDYYPNPGLVVTQPALGLDAGPHPARAPPQLRARRASPRSSPLAPAPRCAGPGWSPPRPAGRAAAGTPRARDR